jgi:RNA polymerase sigma-70 factor (ECF subfamily)
MESSSVGELAALGKLLDEHGPKLLAMLRRRIDPALTPRLDADDLFSEVFLEARRKWARFRAEGTLTPYAWLYRITRDCLIAAWRRENRPCRAPDREMPWPDHSSVQLGLGLVGSDTSPSEAVARADLRERMRQALQLLRPRDQEILWMRHYDDLSFPEAGAVLGISEDAVTLRYVRALRRLKDLWQRLHGGKGGAE